LADTTIIDWDQVLGVLAEPTVEDEPYAHPEHSAFSPDAALKRV